ncbi:uncharacterized protein FIBRA_02781 [Fibroporia radiculosa]|uniref:Calcineurin-like phosphoesterase domain-containing protein n=1 Tax=Fibroporia radiculosa TaxID=599839 RepID=J4I989_9APHY|nr:uncharacterized protein FIBRA_02781 [Fibroporia radiculosa]CCM00741.1 predicted protein [Fibroporia radiculosa]
MRIQIVSDLHLEIERQGSPAGQEFYFYDIPVKAEHLALLGDIGWSIDDRLFDWLRKQLELFKVVYFVSGNHEPYRSSIVESVARFQNFADDINSDQSLGEFIFLNRTRHDVPAELTILGCTLWAALNPDDLDILSWSLTDFRRISSFDPESFTAIHNADLEWLNATISMISQAEPARKIVVFTHHAPTLSGTGDPKYEGQPTNSAFATELTGEPCWTTGNVVLWAFGHTHWSCDFERAGVRVYSNQRGYGEGGPGYSADKTIDL